jgi:mannose-6-phosphate isomerase-like protein (cupin superfamily)
MTEAFRLEDVVLHLAGSGVISRWLNEDSFWRDKQRPELATGQVLSVFSYSTAWDYQERHPDGEELTVVLDGAIDLLLDQGDGEQALRVEAGSACLVPVNTWHRVAPHTPSTLLFITPMPTRTDHRPAAMPAPVLPD